jgi:hypothetical protein
VRPVDVPDYRGTKSVSGEVTLSFSDVADKKFAIGVLGTVNAAEGSPSSETDDPLCESAEIGDVFFLGGLNQHRNITSLVLTDNGSPGGALTVTTDYTLDAASGKVTFVTAPDGDVSASYSHQDPARCRCCPRGSRSTSSGSRASTRPRLNAKGSVELYRVRFDPASLIDFLSDELQIMELKGTVLADPEKEVTDTEFGQFGRRIGFA